MPATLREDQHDTGEGNQDAMLITTYEKGYTTSVDILHVMLVWMDQKKLALVPMTTKYQAVPHHITSPNYAGYSH